MRKRWDIESAKVFFKECGYELLEDEYVNNSFKMRYRCPHHPERELRMCLGKLQSGRRCPYCSRRAKPTFEEVKKDFEDRGYKLLETKYVNNRTRMRYECPCHPDKETFIRYECLKLGQGCPHCHFGDIKILTQTPLEFEEVKGLFESKGYKLLENEYKNNKTKMRFLCPHHPDKETGMDVSALKKGTECRYCAFEKRRGEGNPQWKGGITELRKYLRGLTYKWKQQSLKDYGNKCFVTGFSENLEVHHAKSFKNVFEEVVKELGLKDIKKSFEYEQKELDMICECFVKKHDEVIGVPLNQEVHQLFHKIYGNDVIPNDLPEFKARYLAGEFDEDKEKVNTQIELLL